MKWPWCLIPRAVSFFFVFFCFRQGWCGVPNGARHTLRKLVLSATLTRNPAKLHSLQLVNPISLHATGTGSGVTASA